MSYKFIFDTNVLTEESVEKLRGAGIVNACKFGRFAFYVTPVLLREQFDFIAQGKMPQDAREPIKLLIDLKWQKLFNGFGSAEGIFVKELEGRAWGGHLFIDDYKPHKKNLKLISIGDEFDDEIKQRLVSEKSLRTEMKNKNKESYKEIREEIKIKYGQGKSYLSFEALLDHNFESRAVDAIRNKIESTIPKEKLVEYWRANKDKCPYFNKYIQGFLFILWHFSIPIQDKEIDLNAQDDIEHLLYLIGVDGLVSNEKSFIKAACEKLFPDKEILTVDEFCQKISLLSKLYPYPPSPYPLPADRGEDKGEGKN